MKTTKINEIKTPLNIDGALFGPWLYGKHPIDGKNYMLRIAFCEQEYGFAIAVTGFESNSMMPYPSDWRI